MGKEEDSKEWRRGEWEGSGGGGGGLVEGTEKLKITFQ